MKTFFKEYTLAIVMLTIFVALLMNPIIHAIRYDCTKNHNVINEERYFLLVGYYSSTNKYGKFNLIINQNIYPGRDQINKFVLEKYAIDSNDYVIINIMEFDSRIDWKNYLNN